MYRLLLTFLAAAPPVNPAAAALNARATAAFRAGDFAHACPMFASAAEQGKDVGAFWADAGLCWSKLGERKKAVEANLRTAQCQNKTARRNAYFNLNELGHVHKLNDAKESCLPLENDVACPDPPLTACTFEVEDPGSGKCIGTYSTVLAIGRSQDDLRTCVTESADGLSVIDCPELVSFELREGTTGCCHAGYSKEDCSGGDVIKQYPIPKIVFSDACTGRVGYVLASKKGEEGLVPARSRPVLSFLVSGTPIPPDVQLDALFGEAQSAETGARLAAYRKLAALKVQVRLPAYLGHQLACAPLRQACGQPPLAEKTLFACIQTNGS